MDHWQAKESRILGIMFGTNFGGAKGPVPILCSMFFHKSSYGSTHITKNKLITDDIMESIIIIQSVYLLLNALG